MIFLLDSNAFSDLMRKDARVEAHRAALGPNDTVVICSIVRGEILYGLARLPHGRRRDDLAKQAAPLFASIACQAVPEWLIEPRHAAQPRRDRGPGFKRSSQWS